MEPRDEAAIANAMLLGELTTRKNLFDTGTVAYAFVLPGEKSLHYYTITQAAWMFLRRLGYGIGRHGDLVRLHDRT